MKKVTIYTKATCSECIQCCAMLKRAEVDAQVIDVTDDLETTKMLIAAGFTCVPAIYIGDAAFGGIEELEMAMRGCELDQLLKDD